ncbi:hypothetical protein KY361_05250 [Candidatus Woesearchaeota archaeon]|nr:hypothetical protein [Candidatus Woesearchaeota archaeon]
MRRYRSRPQIRGKSGYRSKRVLSISPGKLRINPYGKTRLEVGVNHNKGVYGNITNWSVKKTKLGFGVSTKGGPSTFAEHKPFKRTKLEGSMEAKGFDAGIKQKIAENTSVKGGVTQTGRYVELKHKKKEVRFPI